MPGYSCYGSRIWMFATTREHGWFMRLDTSVIQTNLLSLEKHFLSAGIDHWAESIPAADLDASYDWSLSSVFQVSSTIGAYEFTKQRLCEPILIGKTTKVSPSLTGSKVYHVVCMAELWPSWKDLHWGYHLIHRYQDYIYKFIRL